MRELIEDVQFALDHRRFHLALMGALTIPDVAAALSSENGRTSRAKYADWYDRWAAHRFTAPDESGTEWAVLQGGQVYAFRCSILHQGSAIPDGGVTPRIGFLEPSERGWEIHNIVFEGLPVGEPVLMLSLRMLVEGIVAAAREWLAAAEASSVFERNIARSVRRRPQGLEPHIRFESDQATYY